MWPSEAALGEGPLIGALCGGGSLSLLAVDYQASSGRCILAYLP